MSILISGCATSEKYNQKLNTWLESPKDDLIMSWGIPDDSYTLDNGKELITYKRSNTSYYNGTSYHYYCNTTFTIENSNIVDWKWEGNNCVSD